VLKYSLGKPNYKLIRINLGDRVSSCRPSSFPPCCVFDQRCEIG
jgi:hypothetical protein